MDLRIERQSRGIVHAVPRPAGGQTAASRPAVADPGSPPTQLFDANSDGVIENWSIAHGGDSFANFDPPPSGTTTSDSKPHRDAVADAAAQRVRTADHGTSRSTSPTTVQHAHDAYRRDGMGAAVPASPPPAATVATPAPAAREPSPVPGVTRPAAPATVRSSAS